MKKNNGIPDLYDECCSGRFYEFFTMANGVIQEGYICDAPVWYADQNIFALQEEQYDSYNEQNSTWKVLNCELLSDLQKCKHKPYNYIQVESEELLAVVKFKIRPVVILGEVKSNWQFPLMPHKDIKYWLCLPIFSYKDRHSQQYVLHDQAVDNKQRFYFPGCKPGEAGLDDEGAGKISQIRCIPQNMLTIRHGYCKKENKARPFQVSNNALNAIVGHVICVLPNTELSGASKEFYYFFKDLAHEQVYSVAKKNGIASFE